MREEELEAADDDAAPSVLPAFRIAGLEDSQLDPRYTTNLFLGQVISLLARLGDHIHRVDSGVTYALDDLAVVLRAWMGESRGNQVLPRLHRAVGKPEVTIRLSRPPERTPDVVFSWGSVPVVSESLEETDGRWASLADWMNTPVVSLAEGKRVTTRSWSTFTDRYSNKWGGSHADNDIPPLLLAAEGYDVGGFTLAGYLLRSAGAQVWLIGQAFLLHWVRRINPEVAATVKSIGPVDSMYLGAEGGSPKAPGDRRPWGDVPFYSHRREQVDLEGLVLPGHTATLRIPLGADRYELALGLDNDGGRADPRPVSRLRHPIPSAVPPAATNERSVMPFRADVRAYQDGMLGREQKL